MSVSTKACPALPGKKSKNKNGGMLSLLITCDFKYKSPFREEQKFFVLVLLAAFFLAGFIEAIQSIHHVLCDVVR